MDMKAMKKKYGVTMAPVEATRAYKRQMPFDHTHVNTESFILINDNATQLPDGSPCNGSRTHINLYNGICGAGYNALKATWALKPEKEMVKVLEGYVPCDVSECAVAKPIPVVPKAPNQTK